MGYAGRSFMGLQSFETLLRLNEPRQSSEGEREKERDQEWPPLVPPPHPQGGSINNFLTFTKTEGYKFSPVSPSWVAPLFTSSLLPATHSLFALNYPRPLPHRGFASNETSFLNQHWRIKKKADECLIQHLLQLFKRRNPKDSRAEGSGQTV